MKSKCILVVDDEPEILGLLEEILSSKEMEVHTASTATEALELVREHIFDAAILDFNLPDMNGLMLHRQLRQLDAELASHTVFTSGLAQSEQNLDYYEAFGRGFLSKPFNSQQVIAALEELWRADEEIL